MKKTLLLASLCVVPAVVSADDRGPDVEEETFTVESRVTVSKDTPEEIKRAIRLELEESSNDIKKEFGMLDGVRVTSRCIDSNSKRSIDSKCAECGGAGKEDNKEEEEAEATVVEKCSCSGKPKPKK